MPELETGLCSTCCFKNIIVSDRGSQFMRCLCEGLPKYPRLPVIQCLGYLRAEKDTDDESGRYQRS